MSRIFISYAHEDRPAVKPLVDGLKAARHEVWWDRRLEGGDEFGKVIEEQLQSADVVLVVWSKRSKASHWVLDEAERGVRRHVLLPLSIDKVRLPLGFGGFQVLDFRAWDGDLRADRWHRLLSSIEHISRRHVIPTQREPIRVLPQAIVLWIGLGTGIGGLLRILHYLGRWEPTVGVFGYPLIDSVLIGWMACAPIALWSAIEVRRAGLESGFLIARRIGKWFQFASIAALVVLVAAIPAEAVAAHTQRERAVELLRVFVVATITIACVMTAFNLMILLSRRVLGQRAGSDQHV